MTCPFEQDQKGVFFKKLFPRFAKLWSSKCLSSDEDVESEIERSIFNMVMPTRVGRERLFTCPVEWEIFLSRWTDVPVSRRCQLVQLFIYYVRAISFRQTTTGNGIWAKLRMGTGIWYTPLQNRLMILLLTYISTRTVVQIVQLLNNSDTLF